MKPPKVLYQGDLHRIKNIYWDHNGEIHHVSFHDGSGKYQTAFQSIPGYVPGNDIIHLDLKTCVVEDK